MSRLARVVIPGLPHHVTQRGNRRQPVFFTPEDRLLYLEILREQTKRFEVAIHAYCLMDNHVHVIATPSSPHGLAQGIGETHRRYTRAVNFREGWRGYLWQGRFFSVPLDTPRIVAAFRYVERNPVRAKLVARAEDYRWSSARYHVSGAPDPVLTPHAVQQEIHDWAALLAPKETKASLATFRRHTTTGRPLGDKAFVAHCETLTHRILHALKPGPPARKVSRS